MTNPARSRAAPRPAVADPAAMPLTIAGAADLVARELRHYDRVCAYQAVEAQAYEAIRRAQRVLFACVTELESPVARRPAARPGRRG